MRPLVLTLLFWPLLQAGCAAESAPFTYEDVAEKVLAAADSSPHFDLLAGFAEVEWADPTNRSVSVTHDVRLTGNVRGDEVEAVRRGTGDLAQALTLIGKVKRLATAGQGQVTIRRAASFGGLPGGASTFEMIILEWTHGNVDDVVTVVWSY